MFRKCSFRKTQRPEHTHRAFTHQLKGEGRWLLLSSWPRGVISIAKILNRNRSCSGYEREEDRGAAMPSRIVGFRFWVRVTFRFRVWV